LFSYLLLTFSSGGLSIVVMLVIICKTTHYFSENLVVLGIEPGPLDLYPGTLTTRLQRWSVVICSFGLYVSMLLDLLNVSYFNVETNSLNYGEITV
jgi:hypothetical protein